MRPDREDLSEQREKVATVRESLARTLDDLQREAQAASRLLRFSNLRGNVDLTDVHAAHRLVSTFEEALDLALLDLRTAAGEDA